MSQNVLLVKLEVLFRKKGSWLYLTKKGKNLSQVTINLVKAFYEDDEFSRQMPGKKIMLVFSAIPTKFCESRPNLSVLARSSGTHSVCVCRYRQNMKLLLAALNVTYQELFPLIVCDINNKECMVHRCLNSPESNILLQDFLFHTIGDFDDDDVIEFSQWTATDRSNLTHHTETVNEYVNIVIELLHILTVHSYISKCQSRYLKKLKSEIYSSTVPFLGDFAENYQFVTQDEVQGSIGTIPSALYTQLLLIIKRMLN